MNFQRPFTSDEQALAGKEIGLCFTAIGLCDTLCKSYCVLLLSKANIYIIKTLFMRFRYRFRNLIQLALT